MNIIQRGRAYLRSYAVFVIEKIPYYFSRVDRNSVINIPFALPIESVIARIVMRIAPRSISEVKVYIPEKFGNIESVFCETGKFEI